MEQERKSPKDDSSDLEARARITFAATSEETEELEVGFKENEDIHEYLDKAIKEANKKKRYPSRIHKKVET
jgi:hypothetical protein